MLVQLTSLLGGSTAFLLAYAIPLLLFSTLITFCGAFLTLDRSRNFAPRSDSTSSIPGAFEKNVSVRGRILRLDGGIGGLAIGYVFGIHTSTFLSLLIMNQTAANPMTSAAFLLVWLFSVFPLAVLGGRWKTAAIMFLGVSGGVTLSIALSIVIHPSLTSRVILAAVVTLVTVLIVVPLSLLPATSQSNLAHSTARMATSCLGAFSVTMAIALLTRSTDSYSWANAWDRLWVPNGDGWGTSRERGFDALFCVLWVTGALTDWALNKWIGEDPEEKWDTYLAEYSSTLPNAHDRAGRFIPLQSWWRRLLCRLHVISSSSTSPQEMIFPSDAEFPSKADYESILGASRHEKPATHLSRDDLQRSVSPDAYKWESPIVAKGAGVLRKGKSRSPGGFKRVLVNDIAHTDPGMEALDLARDMTCLKKARTARSAKRVQGLPDNRRRGPVEFRPKDGFSSESATDDSSDDDELKKPLVIREKDVHFDSSPLVRVDSSVTSLSGTTIHPSSSSGHGSGYDRAFGEMNVTSEKARLTSMKAAFGGDSRVTMLIGSAPEYSDVEEDVTTAYSENGLQSQNNIPGWKPEFLKRAFSSGNSCSTANEHPSAKDASSTPVGAVPVTPSLVCALGRISKAQADAYGPSPNMNGRVNSPAPHRDPSFARRDHLSIAVEAQGTRVSLPITENRQHAETGNSENWVTFWNEIQMNAKGF